MFLLNSIEIHLLFLKKLLFLKYFVSALTGSKILLFLSKLLQFDQIYFDLLDFEISDKFERAFDHDHLEKRLRIEKYEIVLKQS